MKHENAPDSQDQQAINDYVVYLHGADKNSLKVYANSLKPEQKTIARKHLQQYLTDKKQQ